MQRQDEDGGIEDLWELDIQLIDDDQVQFEVTIPDNTFFGLNLGGLGMDRGDDIIIFSANGINSAFLDSISTGKVRPELD